jgi:arylsulfatase A-like enzyme
MTMKPKANLSKRNFLKAAAILPPAIGVAGCGGSTSSSSSSSNYPYTAPTSTPNILFVIVDQLRYPVPPFPTTSTSLNPAGSITSADQFMAAFMPNTYNGIWKNGVVFANNHVGATACGPARAAFVTGLYTQQTWNTATIAASLGNSPPWLDPEYPTYGKLLSSAGYDTPYVGKWHLSVTHEPHPSTGAYGLAQFGFTGLTDYAGVDAGNLQGDYGNPPENFQNDAFIATTAINWLSNKKADDKPWCLTVSFQNPHDYQFFPAGTEWQTFDTTFSQQTGNVKLAQAIDYGSQIVLGVSWTNNQWKEVIDFGYNLTAGTVPNWESVDTLFATKPKWQTVGNQFNGLQFGAVAEDSSQVNFSVGPYPARPVVYSYGGYKNPKIGGGVVGVGIGYAPYSYWQRGLNIYTYGMTRVDQQIGRVLDQLNALPPAVRNNTIVVFTSDHGELAGAHGFISNKTACVYDEAIRVPLVVYDPTNYAFAGDTSIKRTQLTSHVDLAPMFMSFAYSGTFTWMKGDYETLYGQRFNMFPMLKSASASGRSHILFSTDESVDDVLDFANAPDIYGNQTPFHVLGMVNASGKVGIYSNWLPGSSDILTVGQEFEYYAESYTIEGNHSETNNTYGSVLAGSVMAQDLLKNYLPNEMRAPLPASLASAQANAKEQLLAYYASQYSNSNINDSGPLLTRILERV